MIQQGSGLVDCPTHTLVFVFVSFMTNIKVTNMKEIQQGSLLGGGGVGGRGPTLIPTFYWERLTHLVWILRNVTNTQKFSSKNTSHICGGFKAF